MKKICMLFLAGLWLFTGCVERSPLQINDDIRNELKADGIEKSKILKLGDFSKLSVDLEEIVLSEAEVRQAALEMMESYYDLVEYTDRTVVQEGDFVTIEYESVCEGEILADEEQVLKVGAGFFDEDIETSLIGAEIGVPYSLTAIIPDEVEQLAGKEETVTVTVLKIQYMETEELTDEFVRKNFELDSVEEFYDYVKETRELQLNQDAKVQAVNQLLAQAEQLCEYELDEDEVRKAAADIYDRYGRDADSYGYSMDAYMTELLHISDMDNVYEECYDEAVGKIKYKLLVGAVAYIEDIRAEGDDFEIYMENLGLEQNISSEEIAQYKVIYLTTRVKEYLLNNQRGANGNE